MHELGYAECSKSYVFRGSKDYTAVQVQDMLGLSAGRAQGGPSGGPGNNANAGFGVHRFIQPVEQCEFALTSILEELQRDPWPVKNDERPLRCTGTAASIAVALMESCFAQRAVAGRVTLFTSGPCTQGPGAIVDKSLKEQLRSHSDFVKGNNIALSKAASKHYGNLSQRCVTGGYCFDVFSACIDQAGTMEMKELVERTGGHHLMAEEFASPVFKQSFQRLFNRDGNGDLEMAFDATIEVQTSREFKVCGAIGPCASLGKKSPSVGETEIGLGGTCAWKACGIDPTMSLGLFFEVVNHHSNPLGPGQQRYTQITTLYRHSSGVQRLRVTTVALPWIDGVDIGLMSQGFDQEAAASLIARVAIFKTESEAQLDILAWLDRSLIRLASKFGDYRKDDPSSFQLSANFSIYPQFMFHLRRSVFLQIFNSSPDETAFYRAAFNRANVTNSLIMLQPTLLAYTFEGPPYPVLLDTTSIQPDRILLLDTFFHVVIFHGATVAAWRKEKYHEQEGHENFRDLLQAPQLDAEDIMASRFPYPRFRDTVQGDSQSRFLLSKLNPSVTYNDVNSGTAGGSVALLSDDVSLSVFVEALKKLAVQNQQ